MADNCVQFDASRMRVSQRRSKPPVAGDRAVEELFDHLSPAQYAFLSGALAILTEHGEKALIRSCEMVIARFGRATPAN